MKKQLAIATVAVMLTAVLLAPPVMASAGDKTINVGGNQLKVVEVKENNIEDISGGKEVIHIRHDIFGQLDQNKAHAYGYSLTEGIRVRITITHTPTDATGIILGVWDEDFSNGVYIEDNNQDGHAYFPSSLGTYTIPEDGNYYIIVGAQEDGFSYDGWIDFYIG
ncbi:MAG: hypothetical protein IMF19_13890 [Proteobacteria bacterium]|nr:hypothetical protein [Pseudomonadota bacterium]